MQTTPPRRIWPYLLVNLVAAVWIDFTSFHRLMTSDSIIFVLASLYEMRFFYWEQDRVGMMIPLLASWCRHPFHNLLLQSGMMLFAGLTLPVLLARVLSPHRMGALAATVANGLFLLLAPDALHLETLLLCNYPSALVLGLSAILVIESKPTTESRARGLSRIAAAGVLLILAHWQYIGTVAFLGPLVAWRAWLGTGPAAPTPPKSPFDFALRPLKDPRAKTLISLILLAFLTVSVGMREVRKSTPVVRTSPDSLPLAQWPETWWHLAETTAMLTGIGGFAAALGGVCAVGLSADLAFRRKLLSTTALATLPACLAACVEVSMVGTREWTAINGYHPRYILAAILAITTSLALIGLIPILERLPNRFEMLALVVCGLLLLGGATARYGWPSVRAARDTIDEKCGAMTPTIVETGCEAIGGDYWRVWLSMFHANMVLYERGEDRVLFGIAYRCDPMSRRWAQFPDGFRVAVRDDELSDTERMAELHGLTTPFVKIDEGRVIQFPSHPTRLDIPGSPAGVGIYRTRPDMP